MMKVFVYPDDENYLEEAPAWKSDDYEVRMTDVCSVCDEVLHVWYKEPLASCKCCQQEWYK